jgi:type III pantothenate kinase
MLLTIDAGNTRTKWAVFNKAGEITNDGACDNHALSTADLSPSALMYERVIISNVAGEAHAYLLAEKLAPYAMSVRWIKSTTLACGLSNRYDQAETLGTDRWAALIAAWHIKQAPCVVVNAGTAVTIDALSVEPQIHTSQAAFIGGLILPGLNLMQQSLGLAAAQLPKLDLAANSTAPAHIDIFAKNTADAIYAGALHAIVGAIILMVRELNVLYKQAHHKQAPFIVISGGNAPIIYKLLMKECPLMEMTQQALIVDNLVLQGLYLLESFMQSDSQ